MTENYLHCKSCNKKFNLMTREPIFLECCSQTFCKECIATKISTKLPPKIKYVKQDPVVPICFNCNKTLFSVPSKVNNYVKDMVSQSPDIIVSCKHHIQSPAMFISKIDRAMVCQHCANDIKLQQRGECIEVNVKAIADAGYRQLEVKRQKISETQVKLRTVIDSTRSYSSHEILELFCRTDAMSDNKEDSHQDAFIENMIKQRNYLYKKSFQSTILQDAHQSDIVRGFFEG